MLVEFIIGTAVLFVLLLIFSKKKKPEQEAISSEGGKTGDWTDEQGVRFSLDKETLLKAPANLKEYIIPDGVITIQSNAFEGCANLKCVSFPNSVKRIGRFVFNKCDSLTEIRIPAGSREKFEKMLPSDWHNRVEIKDEKAIETKEEVQQLKKDKTDVYRNPQNHDEVEEVEEEPTKTESVKVECYDFYDKKLDDWKEKYFVGRVACKIEKYARERGENADIRSSGNNWFEYQGRIFNTSVIVEGVSVGDIPEPDDYVHIVDLIDMAACRDFRDAIMELKSDEGFDLRITDHFSLSESVSILGEEYKGVSDAISEINSALKEYCSWVTRKRLSHDKEDEMYQKLDKIIGISELDNHHIAYYSIIGMRQGDISLRASKPWDIIERKPSFIEDMERIKNYFEEKNVDEIKKQIHNAMIEIELLDN